LDDRNAPYRKALAYGGWCSRKVASLSASHEPFAGSPIASDEDGLNLEPQVGERGEHGFKVGLHFLFAAVDQPKSYILPHTVIRVESWDDEVKLINKLQKGLKGMTLDQRLIRAQIAQFCRDNPFFPESIEILCKEIGEGRFSNPINIGCEGRGLLGLLGYKDQEARARVLTKYSRSIRLWLNQDDPKTPMDSKILRFLGQPNEVNKVFVDKLLFELKANEPSIASLKNLTEVECGKALCDSMLKTGARPFNCLKCDGGGKEGSAIPECLCCDSMVIDSGLLCIRTPSGEWSVLDEFRRFREEYVLVYAMAINSWLRGESMKPITSLVTTSYVTEDLASYIPEVVKSSLGEKDDAKVWLMACLLKTIRSYQRWFKRTELIDNFPEATSWLREIS